MRRFFGTLCLAGLMAGNLSLSFVSEVQAQSFSGINLAPGSIRSFSPDGLQRLRSRRVREFADIPIAPRIQSFNTTNDWSALPDTVARWPVQKLPLTVFIGPGDGIPGYRPAFRDIAIQANARISILTQIRGVPFSAAELKKIALHEIGHAIGIKGHSAVPSDIMYAVTSPAQAATLSSRDISSVNQIYRSYPAVSLQ